MVHCVDDGRSDKLRTYWSNNDIKRDKWNHQNDKIKRSQRILNASQIKSNQIAFKSDNKVYVMWLTSIKREISKKLKTKYPNYWIPK